MFKYRMWIVMIIDFGCFGWELVGQQWREGGQQSQAKEKWVISWCFGCVSLWEKKSLITSKREGRVAMERKKRERGNKRKNEKIEVLSINFK